MTTPRLTHSCWWTDQERAILASAASIEDAVRALPHRSRKAVTNRFCAHKARRRRLASEGTPEPVTGEPIIYVGASGIPAKKDKRGNYMPYLPTVHGSF